MNNIHVLLTDKPSRLQLNRHSKLFLSEVPKAYADCINQNIYITNDEEIKEGDWLIGGAEDESQNEIWQHDGIGYICEEDKKIILTTDQDLIKNGVQTIHDEFLEWFVKNPTCEFADVNDWMSTNGRIAFDADKRYQLCNHLHSKEIIPKEEPKYPIGGYAPGYYGCTCVTCKTEFMGDKRAVQCEPCAIKMVNTKIKVNDKGGVEIKQQETTLEDASENYVNNEPDSTLKLISKYSFKDGAKWQQKRSYSEEEVLSFGKLVLDTFHSEGRTNSGKDRLARVKFEDWFQQFKK